ncbi:hypothetical protein U6A24_07190 [Aquimarina gracilis]|uniref:Uncharacterized protein n=1 Tax=Aquimarina gracilis TaxID=874422 RepID=A0ABU5ZT26_9FLAO|nr:hypothetical protein [Aquimarina gracilis]MEB3345236.1 hypothetical protein [Aquimarina gracilis]
MTVPEIYNKWKEQWRNGEFRQPGYVLNRYPEIAYHIRESKRVWSEQDIQIFTDYLGDKEKKRFVANLFAIQEQIPEELFEPFIDASIYDTDPSSNQDYLNPCIRVFGFARVIEMLDFRFLHGDDETKKRVKWAYYWVRSPLVTIVPNDGPERVTAFKEKWNGFYYETYNMKTRSNYEVSEAELAEYKRAVKQTLIRRKRMWMEEFLRNTDEEARKNIKASLPTELSAFSEENQELAKKYLKESGQV